MAKDKQIKSLKVTNKDIKYVGKYYNLMEAIAKL